MSSRTRTPVLRTTPTLLRFSTFSISESRSLKKGEHVCSLKILKAHGAWFPPWLTTHASYGTCNNSLEGAWTTNTRCPTSKDECEKKLKVRFCFVKKDTHIFPKSCNITREIQSKKQNMLELICMCSI